MRSSRRRHLIGSYLVLVTLSVAACGSGTPGAGDTVRRAAQAFVDEVNTSPTPDLSSFFASSSATFDPANTLAKALEVETMLPVGTRIDMLRFDILRTSTDRAGTEAVVDYEAQLTVTLPGAGPVTLDITQDVSLEHISSRWLIVGGDAPVVTGPSLPLSFGMAPPGSASFS